MASAAESIFAPIRQAAERAGLAEFARWWKAELFAALPPAWRARFAGGGPALVSPEGGDWVAWTRSGATLVEAGRAQIGRAHV